MERSAEKNRIPELDGFRAIAIFSVVFYHFYWRWAHLPELDRAGTTGPGHFFSFGFLGVNFFFIISGFVIAATFPASKGWRDFWKKRAIRLMPAMVICSAISLIFFMLVDAGPEFQRNAKLLNFFYSLTFIDPQLLNVLLAPLSVYGESLSPCYWSLWPEVQFYLLSSLIYFYSPAGFFRNFTATGIVIILLNAAFQFYYRHSSPTADLFNGFNEIFNLSRVMHWFLAGVLFHGLYTGHRGISTWMALSICIICIGAEVQYLRMAVYIVFVLLLFFLLVYSRKTLKMFSARWLTSIGMASYGLYLIHENIGQWLIIRYSHLFGQLSVLFPLLITLLLVLFSLLLFQKIEAPLSKKLRTKSKRDLPEGSGINRGS